MGTTLVVDHRDLLSQADGTLHLRGELGESRRLYREAYQRAEEARDAEVMAAAALGLGGLWLHEHRSALEAAQVEAWQRRALADIAPDSSIGVRLRVRLAAEADYRTGSTQQVAGALKLARRCDDPLALADALSLAHHCLLGPQHVGVRLRLASELLRAGFLTGRRVDLLMGLLWTTVDRLLAGDPMADRSLAELRDALSTDQNAAVAYVLLAIDVMGAQRAGRFEEAERLAAVCLAAGRAAGDADADGWFAGHITALRWYQGRSAELVPQLERLAGATETGATDRSSYAALAVGYASAGDPVRAACALARVRGRDFTDMVRGSSWLVAMYAAVEAAYLLDDAATAHAASRVLEPYADLPVVLSLGITCLGSTHHVLGVAALTTGDVGQAVAHLRTAVRANQSLGNLPATTWSRYRLAEALRARDAPGDRDEAETETARATMEARALGIAPPPTRQVLTPAQPRQPEPPDPPARPGLAHVVVARHAGGVWLVQAGGRSVTVADAVGMHYLALLVARPGEQVPSVELARAVAGTSATGTHTAPAARHDVLDPRARREYRARLEDLQVRIDTASDTRARETAEQERDWLVSQLATATGLGGRSRTFAHDTERARIAVTKAIRRSLERVGDADAELGAHLSQRVRTGVRCCFDPR